MEIRKDLQEASQSLYRLIEYSNVFRRYDADWSHYKNKEDFDLIYEMPRDKKGSLENIYSDGRMLAGFMADRLIAFNNTEEFPTLKSFVDSFCGGWIDEAEILEKNAINAENIVSKLKCKPWAIQEMIKLYKKQIQLLNPIKQTLDKLKETDIYQSESRTHAIKTHRTIIQTDYSKILNCINIIGKMFEKLPETYSGKREESLRDHILVTLSAAILGSVTGETFNRRGKTDILVRNNDENEFIGECKFWTGEKGYCEAISQLLSYLSWRDTNVAVIIFVKNSEFSLVINKIKECTQHHPNYIGFVSENDETWLNYKFKMIGDSDRQIDLAVMAYHMPS